MDIKRMIKNVGEEVVEHKSTMFTVLGAIGCVASVGFAIADTFKCKEILDEHEGKITKEDALDVGKCYVRTSVSLAATVTCVVLAHKADAAKYAALAALYASDSKKLDSLLSKSKILSDEEAKDIETKISEERLTVEEDTEIRDGNEKMVVYDRYLGRFLKVSMDDLDHALDAVNTTLIDEGRCAISVFYDSLGVEYPDAIEYEGWNSTNGAVGLEYDAYCDSNRKLYLMYSFKYRPETLNPW